MRAWLRWAATVFGAALFISGSFSLAAERAAEVVSIQGIGESRPDDRSSWSPAAPRQPLFARSFVRTGAYSRMGLVFVDRTQLRLAEKTLMEIKAIGEARPDGARSTLRLERGRSWAQTNAVPANLYIETPSATAAIRGTDWEIEAAPDGRSLLTVFSGEVEFFNEFGTVTVRRSEQAQAIPGQAPVKLLIANPRERVQWVTAFSIDPLRHISLAAGAAAADPLAEARRDADSGRWGDARRAFEAAARADSGAAPARIALAFANLREGRADEAKAELDRIAGPVPPADAELERLARLALLVQTERLEEALAAALATMDAPGARQPAGWLVASDIMVHQGRLDRAADHAQAGLAIFRDDPRLIAQLARIDLAGGRFDEAADRLAATLATPRPAFEVRLAEAELARATGDGARARTGYAAARDDRPDDDRPWYGLGVVDSEREAVASARANLRGALARNPGRRGYLGELGTLESFAGNFSKASDAFARAIEANPADFVALTGLGVLDLKRGEPDRALENLLRAGLIEPRYARAHMFVAVAHYQRGRSELALRELARASELDDKDPLPHLLASMIQTDLFRAADAVESARTAMRLLPYLKSLNQVANDRQGSANLGRSLTFFGLEDWAQSRAQESFYPYWAGSHLFLADRYPGQYNKNSELLQGFLSDPTVFGSDNRFQSLVARPGTYGRVLYGFSRGDDLRASLPVLRVNGLVSGDTQVAFLMDLDKPVFHFKGESRGRSDGHAATGAIGVRPAHELGMFFYGFQQETDSDTVTRAAGTEVAILSAQKTSFASVGANYRFGPQSQLWARAGLTLGEENAVGLIGSTLVASTLDNRLPEYAVRHTFDAGAHQFTWGFEQSHRKARNDWNVEGPPGFFGINYDVYDERTRAAFFSDSFDVTADLLVQADAWWQDSRRVRIGDANFGIPGVFAIPVLLETERRDFRGVTPRLGFRWRPGQGVLVRAAWQDWSRPAGLSSLGPVATAGIPADDRLVSRGGRLKRFRGQVEVERGPRFFWSAHGERKEIENKPFSLSPFIVTEDDNLTKLRDFDFGRLGAGDLYEFIRVPEFEAGRVELAGLSANWIPARELGLSSRYVYTRSENTGSRYPGRWIAYHPRHTVALGLTWIGQDRFFLSSRAVYRTRRYTDEANLNPYRAGWDLAADLFWESRDKGTRLRLGIDNALHRERETQYSVTLVFNF